MRELRIIGIIILIIIAIMAMSYFFITITNPNYPPETVDIIQIYITQFNNDAAALFANISTLWDYYPSKCQNVVLAGEYFNGLSPTDLTTNMLLTTGNQQSIFLFIDQYLASVESLISAYIGCNIRTSSLINAISAYNNFMIVIVGYDIKNDTNGDINGIYNIKGMNLITPFGPLRRKILNNDPNAYIMTQAFNNKQGCFIFTISS